MKEAEHRNPYLWVQVTTWRPWRWPRLIVPGRHPVIDAGRLSVELTCIEVLR